MTLQLQTQTTCFPAIKFKPYGIWDDISLILMMISILVIYTGCAYFLLRLLKLTVQRLIKYSTKE